MRNFFILVSLLMYSCIYRVKFNLMLVAIAPTKYIIIFYQNDN